MDPRNVKEPARDPRRTRVGPAQDLRGREKLQDVRLRLQWKSWESEAREGSRCLCKAASQWALPARSHDRFGPALVCDVLSKVQGGLEPRFNPGSDSGAPGGGEHQHQKTGFNLGSTQVQTRFNLGSTWVQIRFEPRFNPGSTRFPGSQTQVEPRLNLGSNQVSLEGP